MSPSVSIPPPQLPTAPPRPPMYGENAEAGMRQKKAAAANANPFGSFLGTNSAPSAGQTGTKTLLGQ
jgi:hypothetical protein